MTLLLPPSCAPTWRDCDERGDEESDEDSSLMQAELAVQPLEGRVCRGGIMPA
jgi:hypothetical protein